MKRVLLSILLIGTLALVACGDEAEFEIEQEIVFIYQYNNDADGWQHWGFFIDNRGNTVDFQLSDKGKEYFQLDELYSYLLELDNPQMTQYISMIDLKTCYDNLLKIDENAEIIEESVAADAGSACWYGVIDDGETPPTFILLSEEGSIESKNTDEHAQEILNILLR